MKPSTEHDYHRRIARVVEAILRDPAAPHSVDRLAAVAGLSPFHFHRIYRALTGEGLAETVQRLRLAQAARRLNDGRALVTEVALDVGYDSPQAFARAFRGFTGVSPRDYQARQRSLGAPDAPVVELIDLPPMEVIRLRHEGPAATIGQTFRTLMSTLWPDDPARLGARRVGMGRGDPEQPEGFVYHAAVAAMPGLVPSGALEAVTLPGGLHAVHRLEGPYALIGPTFQALFGGWLPASGYLPDDRPGLEFYRSPPGAGGRGPLVTDLMIPVRKA